MCILSMVGCTSAAQDDSTEEAEDLLSLSDGLLTIVTNMDEETMDFYINMNEFELSIVMYDSGIASDGDAFAEMVDAWKTAVEENGEFIEVIETWSYEKDGDEAILTSYAQFEDRKADIVIIYKNARLSSLTVDPDTTMNEVLTKAGLNTILGMGTVFSVLIFIAFCISLFKYIPMLEEKFKEKGKKKSAVSTDASETAKNTMVAAPSVETEVQDDLALIAVITAAIAASEGMATDGFVVRSIKRKKSNKWNG